MSESGIAGAFLRLADAGSRNAADIDRQWLGLLCVSHQIAIVAERIAGRFGPDAPRRIASVTVTVGCGDVTVVHRS